jgi:hypothetical protein
MIDTLRTGVLGDWNKLKGNTMQAVKFYSHILFSDFAETLSNVSQSKPSYTGVLVVIVYPKG